jgi:hypothetical protein
MNIASRISERLDQAVDALLGTAYPARGTREQQIKWLSGCTAPDAQEIGWCHGLIQDSHRNGANAVGALWREIHAAELAAGRNCEDFARRFGIIGTGLQLGIDFARVAEEAALEVEEAAVRAEQEKLAAAFEAKRQGIRAQADHRAAVQKQRTRLEKLRLLPSELAAARADVQADLSDLFNPDSIEAQLADSERVVRLHVRLAGIDAASKALPVLLKTAESRLSAFEKNRPPQP